jgi:hypothetical protein
MEVNGQFHALDALPLWTETPSTYWICGSVGPRADWDAMKKRRISVSDRNQTLIPQLFSPQPSCSAD